MHERAEEIVFSGDIHVFLNVWRSAPCVNTDQISGSLQSAFRLNFIDDDRRTAGTKPAADLEDTFLGRRIFLTRRRKAARTKSPKDSYLSRYKGFLDTLELMAHSFSVALIQIR